MKWIEGTAADSLRTTLKHTAIIVTVFMVVMMVWEGQKSDAAVTEGPIPEKSIRLRILANSDGAQDQLVKRQIRDRVVEQMNGWVAELEDPQSLGQARAVIREHLPELEELVGEELSERGIDYGYKVELGVVPFPTKLYGGTVYPAGNYEALRITLGAGEGQNWWCVLFPPLCFIDAGTGDAAAKPAGEAQAKTVNTSASSQAVSAAGRQDGGSDAVQPAELQSQAGNEGASGKEPEVRFFLWDLFQQIGGWISGLWA